MIKMFAAVHESGSVQVFGRRQRRSNHALRRPASEKRQGTKSREVGPRSAVPQTQLWGIERRECRMHASARREVERLRTAKHAGVFALTGLEPQKQGWCGNLC